MKNIRIFLSENFQFLEVKFSIYLNRRVFVMTRNDYNKKKKHLCFIDLNFKVVYVLSSSG